LWHAQTEDSGVNNPHIFTHIFHDGTILATKKIDYDASSDVLTVQKLMQAQHKAILRELKAGGFDDKIVRIYGPIVHDPESEAKLKPAHPEDERTTVPDLSPMLASPPAKAPQPGASSGAVVRPPPDAPRHRPSLTPARPAIAVSARSGGTNPNTPLPPTLAGRAAARAAPPTIGSGRSGAAQTNRPTAEGVIVGRPTAPAVIVGGGKDTNREAQDFWKTERRAVPAPSVSEPQFGGDLISEKSLDEVILAYLSEDAPKK
jgi:hypothetical protein